MTNIEKILELLPSLEKLVALLKENDIKTPVNQATEFENLKKLLLSDNWPHAVNPAYICDKNSEEDKFERAEGIIELIIDRHLKDLSFLDFGCGEGHVVKKSMEQKPKITVGYDIQISTNFAWNEAEDNALLTNNFDMVKEKAPYDIILLYDVLDHLEEESMTEAMQKIREVTTPKSKIFIRCHPWCGRHGGHLYTQINKAFAHLVFSDEELKSLGYTIDIIEKVTRPLATYRQVFQESGFKVENENIDESKVEPFFSNNQSIKNRIVKSLKLNKFNDFQLKQSFIDYALTKI